MAKLVEIPDNNGNWIDPDWVFMVWAGGADGSAALDPPRVEIHYRSNFKTIINCDSVEVARSLRRLVLEAINSGRSA